jgi:NADPH-dependent glutamate synthase beta subunit-like oxidoreductase/coenzyme F420-reducing hydrogenase delta subunit/NAD-dependent dihydropyrimidine dehydrogenase PreA subunit
VRALKRFVADWGREQHEPDPHFPLRHDKKVAVIGSGPAGLTAAWDLRREGWPVTIFEGDSDPGGMLRWGITAYRLPREILAHEIEQILAAGIHLESGRRLGRDFDLEELERRGFAATVLAVGAQRGRRPGLPDESEHPEIQDALAFLRRFNAGEKPDPGRRVLVLGGGSTAVETARAARRLGASQVTILYRRSEDELLAGSEEIEAARREGIDFEFLIAPTRVHLVDGSFAGLVGIDVGLRHREADGRRRPVSIPGTEKVYEADRVLAAVGQEVDLGFLPSRHLTDLVDDRRLKVDAATGQSRVRGLFAAGDMVHGPSTVIDAIADGHRVASGVSRYLLTGRAQSAASGAQPGPAAEYELPDPPPLHADRQEPVHLPLLRGHEMEEVELGLQAEAAVREASRCLRCGPCSECRACSSSCGRRHFLMEPEQGEGGSVLLRAHSSLTLSLATGEVAVGRLTPDPHADPADGIGVRLRPVRARVEEERCRGCGTCTEVCPFGAVSLVRSDAGEGEWVARIEDGHCRGCNLCVAACPTGAAVAGSHGYDWWRARLDSLARRADADTVALLACQRRGGALDAQLRFRGRPVELIRLRCVGQVDTAMLLELLHRGAKEVVVAGCDEERCRFGGGAQQAAQEVWRAHALLRRRGEDPERIRVHWSPGREADAVEEALARTLEDGPADREKE